MAAGRKRAGSGEEKKLLIIPRLLIVLGGLLVALQSELTLKLLRAALGWAQFGWPPQASETTPLDDIQRYGYRLVTLQQPLLPWLLWLVGAIWLLLAAGAPRDRRGSKAPRTPRTPRTPRLVGDSEKVQASLVSPQRGDGEQPNQKASQRITTPLFADSGIRVLPAGPPPTAVVDEGRTRPLRRALVIAALLAICGLGAATRGANLLPDPNGVWPASNFDEQVYYTDARLLAQGELPYRDHFLAHPPGSAYVLGLALAAQPRWGGAGAFGAARQWLLVLSLLAVPLVFLCGRRLGGDWAGLLAALLIALDGKAAGVAVLETLVNVFSLLALLLYLYRPHLLAKRQQALWLLLAGFCCGWAILMKVPGLALAAALPLHALLMRRPRSALLLVAGTVGGLLLGLLPFLIAAPSQLLRETFFFQMLRPQEVSPGIDEAARIAAYPESLITTAAAAAGLLLLSLAIMRAGGGSRTELRRLRRWLVLPLWAVPVLAVFVLGRSYHSPYMVQWVPPLALLGGALASPRLWLLALDRRLPRLLGTVVALATAIFVLPLLAVQWQATFFIAPDTVYRPAAQRIQQLSTVDDAVLAFDPGYAFVAGRAPVLLPDGQRLVDSAGAMTFYALGLDSRAWGDMLGDVLRFNKERNAAELFQSTPAQAAVLGGLWNARLAVVDGKIGLPQLRGQSLGLIAGMAPPPDEVEHVRIYSVEPDHPANNDFPGLMDLRAVTLELLNADGSGQGAHVVPTFAFRMPVLDATPQAVLQIGLYWQKPTPDGPDYRVVLRLDDPSGAKAQQSDRYPDQEQGHTAQWRANALYPDLQNLPLPATPGVYTLHIGLYDPNNPASLQEWQAPVLISTGGG